MSKRILFDSQRTVFLIDGSSFLYRAYYGVRPLHTSKGIQVQAVYSFCRMIRKLVSKFGARYIALIWDSKGKTTRHKIYEAYKATRQAPPSDIFDQKKIIVDIAGAIGIYQMEEPGIEADDIIFSVVQDLKKSGDCVVIITSDKDMGQILDNNVFMFDLLKDQVIDVSIFEERMGVEVAKLSFYFALLGDVSDNIPGVRGIGKKGASELVNKFESLQDLYNNLDKVTKPAIKQALKENKENAFLSERLFLLQYHPTGIKKNDLIFDTANWVFARPFFEELEFKSLLRELSKDQEFLVSTVKAKIEHFKKYTFKIINNRLQLKDLCLQLKKKEFFAVDTETSGCKPLQDDCVGISICYAEGESFYIPFGHMSNEPQLSKEDVVETLKPIFESPTYKKILHHSKFDQLVLWNLGIELQGVEFDTLIAARLLAKDWQKSSLKDLSIYYFQEPMLTYQEVVKANKYKNFSYVPLELAKYYAAADAHQTFKLAKILKDLLQKEGFEKLYYEIEFPLINILFNMERVGIYINTRKLAKIDKKLIQELVAIKKQIISLIGDQYKGINLNSPKQVEELLFVYLKLPTMRKSAKGKGYSTNQLVLSELSKIHPVPGLILRYREFTKLKTTYVDTLPYYINPKTGRVHSTFNQTAVATGRLASADPNLQNIPADNKVYGLEIRAAFEPLKGNIYLAADYSQIELRVLAALSQDKNLSRAFLENRDIHTETASLLFSMPFDQIKNEQRQIGKRINFSVLYGMTPYGLSQDLGISLADAKQYINKYFEQYPGVSTWMESIIDFAKKNGYVTTYGGRRRYIPGIYEKNKTLYDLSKRVAINTVAQGTASEIVKMGMINLFKEFCNQTIDAEILLQIHDELLISVLDEQKHKAEAITKKILESVINWHVPMVVSTRFGYSWKEVTK